MELKKIIQSLDAKTITKNKEDKEIRCSGIVASDLMSDVLVQHQEGFLLITGLVSEQVVRTATIVGAPVVVFVCNKKPQQKIIELAEEEGIILLSTGLSTYQACVNLSKLMENRG
ncbi:DRTGG domain-containing protein [Spirochaetia bacterium 38H-sp]|uniref:DRTGG domain-containing protein n=1 Tax=Rarispira pelagica TaxID=3141764 RepID=A0ABU9UCR2_9SPIR